MLRVAICDDMQEQIDTIRASTERYFELRGEDIKLDTFNNPLIFLESIEFTGGYDIVLLDICMPGITGTEAAREIRQRKDITEIIFFTTSIEYAVEAFALKAAHYLVKPYSQTEFVEAMDRAVERISEGQVKKMVVRADSGDVRALDINDIEYIESNSHKQSIYMKQAEVVEIRSSLSGLLEELRKMSPRQFFSPYKGYIVNQRAIASIEPKQILLQSGQKIAIARGSYRELRAMYFDYMFEGK